MITIKRVTSNSTLLRWNRHVDEPLSEQNGRTCYFHTAASTHTFPDAARGEYRLDGDDDGNWTVQLVTYQGRGDTSTVVFTEQHNILDEAQSAAQRHEDALHAGVGSFMRQPRSDRAGHLAAVEQILDDARRCAAVLHVAEASVRIRDLADDITHVHVNATYTDDGSDLTLVRFVDAAGAEVDVWDSEDTARFEAIQDLLAAALDLAGSDFLLFTYRARGADETGGDTLTVPLFPANYPNGGQA